MISSLHPKSTFFFKYPFKYTLGDIAAWSSRASRPYVIVTNPKLNPYVIVSLLDNLEPLVLVSRRVIVAHARELRLEEQTEGTAGWHRRKVGKVILHNHCDVEAA
jgi:hypothetical protein